MSLLYLSLLSFLATIRPAVSQCTPTTEKYDVVIIGAGMAGLSAGKKLRDVDPALNFTILEAQNGRVGGRVRSNRNDWFPGYTVEECANWLSDETQEPVLDLANEYGVKYFLQDFDDFNLYEYNSSVAGAVSSH